MSDSAVQKLNDAIKGVLCASWWTLWHSTPEIRAKAPPRHSDFRDHTPPTLQEVAWLYEGIAVDGKWTNGLIQMWNPKNKFVKSSVHVPCFDSFKWNPFLWRGIVLGRTCQECYWTGLRQTRWARSVYAANLGREYVFPYRGIGRHGYLSDIKALCWTYCLISCIFSCGIGQVFSLCGNVMCNFGAIYSCHARRKLRARYRLPPTFGLPPGMDDFLTHFLCFYCSSHQEIREIAARGVDGPGLHILDVLPDSFARAPRGPEAAEARKVLRDHVLAHPPPVYRPSELRRAIEAGDLGFDWEEELDDGRVSAAQAIVANIIDETDNPQFGWLRYPPKPQVMSRNAQPDGAEAGSTANDAARPLATGAPGMAPAPAPVPAAASASALPHPATSGDLALNPSLKIAGSRSIELAAPAASRSKARTATGAAFDLEPSDDDDDLDSSTADASSSAPSGLQSLSDREKIERFMEKSRDRSKGVAGWAHKSRTKGHPEPLSQADRSRAAAAAFAETASAAGLDLDAGVSASANADEGALALGPSRPPSAAGRTASSSHASTDLRRAAGEASSQTSGAEGAAAPSASFTLPPSSAPAGRPTIDTPFNEALELAKQKHHGPKRIEKRIEQSITKSLDIILAKPIHQIASHTALRLGESSRVVGSTSRLGDRTRAETASDVERLRDESEPATLSRSEPAALGRATRDQSAPPELERPRSSSVDAARGGGSFETHRAASRLGEGDGSRVDSQTAPSTVSAESAVLRSGFEDSQAPRLSMLPDADGEPRAPASVTFGSSARDRAAPRHAVATVTGPRAVPMHSPPRGQDNPVREIPAEAIAHIAALPHMLRMPETVPTSAEPRAGGPLHVQVIEATPTDEERQAEVVRLASPDWEAMQLEIEMNVEPKPLTRAWSVGY